MHAGIHQQKLMSLDAALVHACMRHGAYVLACLACRGERRRTDNQSS
jgi:hypothetical protein